MSDSERGKPASFDRGGGQGREDYDQDSMAGSGQEPPHGARPADRAMERPVDPDEGV